MVLTCVECVDTISAERSVDSSVGVVPRYECITRRSLIVGGTSYKYLAVCLDSQRSTNVVSVPIDGNSPVS